MKRILSVVWILFFVSLSVFAQDNTMKLTLHTKDKVWGDIVLTVGDLKETMLLDEHYNGSVTVSLDKPMYAILKIAYGKTRLYLEPGKDLDLTLSTNKDGSYSFFTNNFEYRGPNAAINEYLNTDQVKLINDEDFLLDEDAFIAKIKKLDKENAKLVRRQKFPKDYEKMELMRVKYLVYEALTRYPLQHFWKNGREFTGLEQYEDTPKVKAFIPGLCIDSDEAWTNYAYQKFLSSAISILSAKNGYMGNDKNKEIVNRLQYLTEHFKSPKILEDMIHNSTMNYVEMTEGKPLGEIEQYYNRYVKNEKYKKELADALAVWAKLGKGTEVKSNDFKYQDIEGNRIALGDLKGKYVYIDVWATWCGPCCAELPHLKMLEKQFEGKNIYFVSISVDESKAAWVKKVQKDHLGGIQLHGGAKAQIKKDYMINAIPRFILLDREGKVIDRDMSRPSDPETAKTLNALEGI